jgi:hypothetical protein
MCRSLQATPSFQYYIASACAASWSESRCWGDLLVVVTRSRLSVQCVQTSYPDTTLMICTSRYVVHVCLPHSNVIALPTLPWDTRVHIHCLCTCDSVQLYILYRGTYQAEWHLACQQWSKSCHHTLYMKESISSSFQLSGTWCKRKAKITNQSSTAL